MKSEQTSRLKKRGKKLVRGVKTFGIFRARSQLSFAQKIIKKSSKLENVVQLAQMYPFAPDPGKEKVPPLKSSYNLSENSSIFNELFFALTQIPEKRRMWGMSRDEVEKSFFETE